MVSYFLIFLAIMLAAAVAVYVVGLRRPGADVFRDGLQAPVAGLPPVLLPAVAAPEDVDRVRFALGLRGYRMDQVDEVLDRLRDELAAKDLRIAELEASDAGHPAAGVGAAPDVSESDNAGQPAAAPGAETDRAAQGGAASEGGASGVEPGKES